MAKTVIALEAKLEGGEKLGQTVGNIKQELREANKELIAAQQNFGDYSAEAIAAAQKVAGLKDSIKDAKETADLFDPGKKFQALTNVLNVAAGGFAALQGAQALFGSESEELQKTLVKVQGALALSQGLSQIAEAGEAFGRLGAAMQSIPALQKAITLGQKAWNAAMAANPIGAIIVAITALIGAIVALTAWFGKNSAAARQNAAAVAESTEQLKINKRALDEAASAQKADAEFKIAMAKASGKSKEEVRKLTIAEIDAAIAIQQSALQTERATLARNEYQLATLKAKDADEELIKQQEENVKASKEAVNNITNTIKTQYEDRLKTERSFQIEDEQIKTDAAKKSAEAAKQAGEKAAEAAKQRNEKIKEANKQADENLLKLQQETTLKLLKNEREREAVQLEQNLENQKREIENTVASRQKKDAQLKLLEEQYNLDLQALKDKYAKEDKEKQDQRNTQALEAQKAAAKLQLDVLQMIFDKRQMIADTALLKAQKDNKPNENDTPEQAVEKINKLEQAKIAAENAAFEAKKIKLGNDQIAIENLKQQHENALTGIEDEAAKARKDIAQKEFEAKQALLGALAGELNKFADVVGKETVLGKALAAAGALVDTYKGIAAGVKLGFPKAIPAVAFAAATGFKAVKSILAVKVPGKGGSGGGAGAAPTVTAPVAPTAETTMLNQESINAVGNAASRAFVLETDVSNNQERIRRLNRAARIN